MFISKLINIVFYWVNKLYNTVIRFTHVSECVGSQCILRKRKEWRLKALQHCTWNTSNDGIQMEKTNEGTELRKKLLRSQYTQKTLGTVLSELGSQQKRYKIVLKYKCFRTEPFSSLTRGNNGRRYIQAKNITLQKDTKRLSQAMELLEDLIRSKINLVCRRCNVCWILVTNPVLSCQRNSSLDMCIAEEYCCTYAWNCTL